MHEKTQSVSVVFSSEIGTEMREKTREYEQKGTKHRESVSFPSTTPLRATPAGSRKHPISVALSGGQKGTQYMLFSWSNKWGQQIIWDLEMELDIRAEFERIFGVQYVSRPPSRLYCVQCKTT
jgi:hypothetical protein